MGNLLRSDADFSASIHLDDLPLAISLDNLPAFSCCAPASQTKWNEVIDHLLEVRHLSDDWDGQGAKAPSRDVVDTSLRMATMMQKDGYEPPDDFGATVNGEINLGWHSELDSMVVEITVSLSIQGYRWHKGDEQATQFVLMHPR